MSPRIQKFRKLGDKARGKLTGRMRIKTNNKIIDVVFACLQYTVSTAATVVAVWQYTIEHGKYINKSTFIVCVWHKIPMFRFKVADDKAECMLGWNTGCITPFSKMASKRKIECLLGQQKLS